MENNFEHIYTQSKKWVLEAGQLLKDSLNETIDVQYKTSASDLVTDKDREIEQFFIDLIQDHYPEHYIIGEEGMSSKQEFDPRQEVVWIIDPIDGTTNFVHQQRCFAISVAVFEKGEPRVGLIYDPMGDEFFHVLQGSGVYLNQELLQPLTGGKVEESLIGLNHVWLLPSKRFDGQKLQPLVRAARGTRSIGSAALEIAYVACGRLDAYITWKLSPWDFAAGFVMNNELGATITTIDHQPIDVFQKSSIFIARPTLHQEITANYL